MSDKVYERNGEWASYTNFSGIELPNEAAAAETFLKPILRIGTSSVPVHMKTDDIPIIDVHATTALVSDTLKVAVISLTQTVADAAGNTEVLKVQLTSTVRTGGWVNAIFGRVNFSSTGYPYGSASAVCGEMSWPTTGAGIGTFAVFQAELDIPTTTGTQVGAVGSVFRASLWGDGASKFDDKGYLFDLQGFTPADGGVIDSSVSGGTGDGGIRIRIGTSEKWLLYADDQS